MGTWTILKTIQWLTVYLEEKGIKEARLSAEHLLAHVLGLRRLDLYLQFERALNEDELSELKVLIKRRATREPLQYILGTQPFRNLEIKVNSSVLIPRPETELVVQKALEKIPIDADFDILELGIGSGAISAAIADERQHVRITATEISDGAIKTAIENTSMFKERIKILKGNLFEPVVGKIFDIIVSNPPYVSLSVWEGLSPEVRDFEPKEALVGGKDGLDFYRRIIKDSTGFLKPGGWLVLELGDTQKDSVVGIARENGSYRPIETHKDYNGTERIFLASRGM